VQAPHNSQGEPSMNMPPARGQYLDSEVRSASTSSSAQPSRYWHPAQ
jgi:hypothetical protein